MRTLLFFLIFTIGLFSKETIEVFAKEVKATATFLEASGDVIILYDGALLKAKHATYDKETSLLILDGQVEMLGKEQNRISSEHLVLDTSQEAVKFKELFLATENDLWIAALKAQKKGEKYKIFKSELSSCNKLDPDWKITFAEAYYNKTKNYMRLDDASLIFFDRKIFSFPFLVFPTINERTTGLLIPNFKLSNRAGLIYQQPFFYAPKENLDVEFNPQVQMLRGAGAHVTTRFVDSNHSKGEVRVGYFKNFDSYAEKHNLHDEHYGFEFLYSSTDFLPKTKLLDDYKSGLYLNSTYLNDLEYLNLQQNRASSLVNSNLIESRFNAFVHDEKEYFGLYGKYYIDTSRESNSKTLQELPTFHYHRYLESKFSDNLLYSFDAKVHNYTRRKGSQAKQLELDLPITYVDSFLDDYLDLSFSENLYLSSVSFANLSQESDNYSFYRNYHKLELSSDLVKAYDEGTHTLHPSVVYTRPTYERENPTKYKNLNVEQRELFVTQTELENVSFGLSQYFYNAEFGMNLFHRLSWTKFKDDTLKEGDINSEFEYGLKHFNLYSNLYYSFDEKRIHSLTNRVGYNQNNYDIMLTHFYNYDLIGNTKETNFINASLNHNYDSHNKWFLEYDYDLEQSFNHQWNLGWEHREKCWGAKISIGQEEIPNVDSSFTNNMLYFELNLNPFGGISQNIEQEFSTEGR